jgi:cystathionine beta-lyase
VSKKNDKPETNLTQKGRKSAEHHGAVNTPVYRASTILYPDLASLEGNKSAYSYGRRATPTSRSLEELMNTLEGGARTVLCPSGLNACNIAILAVCSAGDHLLMTDSAYEPTRAFCDMSLKRLGIETTYYDPTIGAGIEKLMRPNTKAVFCESPGSLTFEVQDIPAIAQVAHKHGASVLLDNTWATPLLFPALKHGVDLSIHAATKYIGGHADILLGTITANTSHAERLSKFHGNLGLYASGDDCFLALRGLRTLAVRLKRHQETATILAEWLAKRPEVSRILYPALASDPGHAIWKRDFSGASGLFGVVFRPASQKQIAAFVDGLSHFGLGWSWGGFESLIVPAHIHRTAKAFAAEGPVLRIHAGLEDPDDLIADLEAGLERMKTS